MVDLQCYVNFCCTEKWLFYIHIYILSYILFHLSQSMEYSLPYCTVEPCCLSILQLASSNPKLPVRPLNSPLPLATTRPFSMTVSLFPFHTLGTFVAYFRFHIQVILYGIWLSGRENLLLPIGHKQPSCFWLPCAFWPHVSVSSSHNASHWRIQESLKSNRNKVHWKRGTIRLYLHRHGCSKCPIHSAP